MAETAVVTLNPRKFRGDRLIPWSLAAKAVGVTGEQLREWVHRYQVPALRTDGGNWMSYQSWVDEVLASARPGEAPRYREATDRWWAERVAMEVA